MARINTLLFLSVVLILSIFVKNTATAQVSVWDENRRGSLYFSIGTNSTSYSSSTININQSSLGNNYSFNKVSGDNNTNSSGGILHSNFRAGYFFDFNQKWAVELNYDPVNYHVTDGQSVHVSGTMDGATINKTMTFSTKNGYEYYLNGANFVLINAVRRFGLYRNKQRTFAFDLYLKAGAGPVMPHVLNNLDEKVSETPQFQVGGWNAALEAALRLTIVRHVYLEIAPKYDYASYTNLNVYNGTATQKLTTTEFVFSLGYAFSTTRHNPLFEKPQKSRKVVTIRAIYPDEAQ